MPVPSRPSLAVLALMVVISAAVPACTPIETAHGYVPSPAEMDALRLGSDTRQTVARAIGRPAIVGVLAGSDWFYIRSNYRQIGVGAPQETGRQIVALTFDDKDRLTGVQRFDLADGRVVPISRRVTDSGVRSVGLLDQLGRNLGRVNAEQMLAQP